MAESKLIPESLHAPLLLIVGLLLGGVMTWKRADWVKLSVGLVDHARTEAEVLAVERSHQTPTYYFLTVGYEVDGERYSEELNSDYAVWSAPYRRGETVPVVYDPERPERVLLAEDFGIVSGRALYIVWPLLFVVWGIRKRSIGNAERRPRVLGLRDGGRNARWRGAASAGVVCGSRRRARGDRYRHCTHGIMTYEIDAREQLDESFGFPVVIHDAPERSYDGRRALDVGVETLNRAVLVELIRSSGPWTGAAVTFVRHWLGDTLEEFAERVGVSHPAVIKWEDAEGESTPMSKGNEYLIRAQVAAQLRAKGYIGESEFADLVSEAMDFDPDEASEPVEIDGMELVGDDWGDGDEEVAS